MSGDASRVRPVGAGLCDDARATRLDALRLPRFPSPVSGSDRRAARFGGRGAIVTVDARPQPPVTARS